MRRIETSLLSHEGGAEESNVAKAIKAIGDIVEEKHLFPVEVVVCDNLKTGEGLRMTEEELCEVIDLLQFDRAEATATFDSGGSFEVVHRSNRLPLEFIEYYHYQKHGGGYTSVYHFRSSRKR